MSAPLHRHLVRTIEAIRRPALAPGVRLAGRLQGSGYAAPQWLVERDGKFVQVSELLYRIAELADGRRTLGEIAAEVTDSGERTLGADDVQHLIHRKLVPLGVIAPPEPAPTGAARRKAPASPLALTIRARVIGPRAIRPVANVLKLLYEPPIMVPLLAGAVAIHAWLYLVPGVGGAAAAAVLRPDRLLLVLGIVAASSVFHEFGHAAALRHGGGEVRGMGAGVYLIYPIFYTDVTDGYRLGRRARVRTDLGGIYFHLLFATALICVAIMGQQTYLLLAVVLIDLEMARQFVPFVRLDGYWLLADLTGIPDPFSHVRPFLAQRLGLGRGPGGAMPVLRPRIRAIFGAYVALTIPVLTGLAVLLLIRLPGLADTAWRAFSRQAALIPDLIAARELVPAGLSLLELAILGVPFVGLAYSAYYLVGVVLRLAGRVRYAASGVGQRPPVTSSSNSIAAPSRPVAWKPR